MKRFMHAVTKPKEIRPGLRSSIAASYLVEEIEALLRKCLPGGYRVEKKAMGLLIIGTKLVYGLNHRMSSRPEGEILITRDQRKISRIRSK